MKKKKKLIIIIAAVVVLAGGGAGIYFTMFNKANPVDGETVVEEILDPPGLVKLTQFLVNINDGNRDHFAKIELAVTIQPAETAKMVMKDPLLLARMRDRVLTLLTSKQYQELTSAIGKEGLRREVKAHLSPLLEGGTIEDVLFEEFVIQ